MKYEHLVPEWTRLYNSGDSIREIARKYDIDYSVVNKTLSTFVQKRPRSKWASYGPEWVKLYEEGYTKTEIAKQYKTSSSVVSRIMEAHGIIPERKVGKYDELKDTFIDMYVKGESLSAISQKYGITTQTIANYLDREGIERRSYSESGQVYDLNQSYFDIIDSPLKAYHLGLLFSFGSLLTDESKFAIQVSVSFQYEALLDELINVLRNGQGKKEVLEERQYIVRFYSEHLYHRLQELGISQQKMKYIPVLNERLYPAFYYGLFAKFMPLKRIDITANEEYLEQVKRLLVDIVHIDEESIKYYVYPSRVNKQMLVSKKSEVTKFVQWMDEGEGVSSLKRN